MNPVDVFWDGAAIRTIATATNGRDVISRVTKADDSKPIPQNNFILSATRDNGNFLRVLYCTAIRQQIIFCQETDSYEKALGIMLVRDVTRLIVRNESGAITGRVEMEAVLDAIIAGEI